MGEETDLRHALNHGPDETAEWLHSVVEQALTAALDEAEAAFRVSLTPEQAFAQVVAGPTAVA